MCLARHRQRCKGQVKYLQRPKRTRAVIFRGMSRHEGIIKQRFVFASRQLVL